MKKCTTHFTEFYDFLAEHFFGNIKMTGQAGKAEIMVRAAVDHFLCQSDFVRNKRTAALGTDRIRRRVIHFSLTGGTDTVSYHGRGWSD